MQLCKKSPNYKEEIIKNSVLGGGELLHVQYEAGCTGYRTGAINQVLGVQKVVTLPGKITEDRDEGRKSHRQRKRHK